MIRTTVSRLMKAKEVRQWCKKLQAAANTADGKKELQEWDEWIRNVIEVNRPCLAAKQKQKAANAATLTA